jgi:hypothetical protein
MTTRRFRLIDVPVVASATIELALQVLEVHREGVHASSGQSHQEVRPVEPRGLGGHLLRELIALVPVDRRGQPELATELLRRATSMPRTLPFACGITASCYLGKSVDGREHPADRGRGDQAIKTGGLRIDLSGGALHGPTALTTGSLASRSASIAARASRSAPRTDRAAAQISRWTAVPGLTDSRALSSAGTRRCRSTSLLVFAWRMTTAIGKEVKLC